MMSEKVSAEYILTCIQRQPLYKGHYEVALVWLLNTGFHCIYIATGTRSELRLGTQGEAN